MVAAISHVNVDAVQLTFVWCFFLFCCLSLLALALALAFHVSRLELELLAAVELDCVAPGRLIALRPGPTG